MKIVFPTDGGQDKIYQGFGENPNLYAKLGLDGHNGWDISPVSKPLEPIYAPYDGVISKIRRNQVNGYGNAVSILSNEENGQAYMSTLAHMSSNIPVQVGDKVKAGDKVGEMCNSGFVISTGAQPDGSCDPNKGGHHLHWTLKPLEPVETQDKPGVYITVQGKLYRIIYQGNGYGGAVDPGVLFNMNEDVLLIDYKGKIGLLFVGGFTGNILFARDMNHLRVLGELYDKDIVVNQDGGVENIDVVIQ